MQKINLQILKKHFYRLGFYAFFITILLASSCKKELKQINPNAPTLAGNVNNEAGVTAYALGGVYWNGFNYGDGWLGNSYFSLPWGYHELMGDVAGGGAGSNNQTTTMGVPDHITPDPVGAPGTVITNPSPQVTIIRNNNNTAATAAANNALYYEWLNMYAMINVMNTIIVQLPSVSGLTPDKDSTIKAWCYWWKGYAYAQIGTLYYAGLIENTPNTINKDYVSQSAIITESNNQLNNALKALQSISNQGDYGTVIAELIPQQCQVGLGIPLSSSQWMGSINTLLARNILLNKLSPFVNGNPSATITGASIPNISSSDWTSIISYCTSGIQNGDYVFTGRTTATNSFFTPVGGSVASLSAASNQITTYKVSERLVQQFQAGDNRLANFTNATTFTGDAVSNSTRYSLVDGAALGLTGIPILGSRQPGGLEIYIGPTYEENALMLAEAYIQTGKIQQGLALIDAVRTYQGAGVAPVGGSSLTLAQALSVLTQERLAALAYRGLSYYDLRRWGWTYGAAKGGGRWGCNVWYNSKLYTNAYIDYNYMDYWDVTQDETTKNIPSSTSAAVVNPNY
ncbi:MAG TPA: RagB/SusD family nutrient uptake outer membrane protein [Puia sp.]|nr:RagB/SusD family nutrient uptake outer membrane protein [Puia sp.]